MTRRLAALALVLALLLGSAWAAQAQTTTCPENRVCVEYTNGSGGRRIFALDPNEGYYQEIVVAELETVVRDFWGEHTEKGPVKLASFLSDGDTYKLLKVRTEERTGIYAEADLGDSFGLKELK